MTEQSYKILAAKRLAVDPNELIMFTEIGDRVLATTFDGQQHIFTKAELNRPAKINAPAELAPTKEVAEKALKGSDQGVRAPGSPDRPVKNVAKPKTKK
jgi:hypothetical protein